MNTEVSRQLETYFQNVPSARAALDNLCSDGCDESTVLEFVGFLRVFKEGESLTTSAKCRMSKPPNKRKAAVEPNLVARRLAKDAAMVSQLHQNGVQFFVDLAATEADLARLKKMSPSATFNEKPKTLSDRGSVNLLNLSQQMASVALLLQEASSYRLTGVSDLVQKNFLAYVKQTTGRAHYDDISNLFPGGADGEGHFSPDALKQWAHEHKELPCTTPC
jgi:hypothetical protein